MEALLHRRQGRGRGSTNMRKCGIEGVRIGGRRHRAPVNVQHEERGKGSGRVWVRRGDRGVLEVLFLSDLVLSHFDLFGTSRDALHFQLIRRAGMRALRP